MGKTIDEKGKVYTHLTVLEQCTKKGVTNRSKKTYWLCKCRCGNTTKVLGYQLRKKIVRSCGCYSGKRFRGEKEDPAPKKYKSEIDTWCIGFIIFTASLATLFILCILN